MSGKEAADVEALRHMRAADPAAYQALMEKFKKEPTSPAPPPKTPGPTTGWQSALQALETKNVKFETVLGKLLIANDQAQGHLHHAFTRQQQMGEAIKDLQKDVLENKKAIEHLKKQQVAAISTPSKSRISSLQSLSGGILGAQTSILSDKSPFDTEG